MEFGKRLTQYYLNEDMDFYFVLRSELIWDAEYFAEFEASLVEVLGELDGQEVVPRWIAATFSWEISSILGIARREDVVVRRGDSLTKSSSEIDAGVSALIRYQHWFGSGLDPNKKDQ